MEAETHTELPWDLLGPSTGGLSIGIVLQGTYRIVRPLAEGGCGEIYLAAHTRLPGRFAVKLLHRSLVRDSDAFSRFQQEAEITSSLRHPHIVQVFDFNVTDSGVPYLVMELLEGKLLAQRIAAGPLDPIAAVDIIDQIASALNVAHSRGIVHRDLKPENVMLLADAGVPDFVKVLDFGISQASWRPRLTEGERVAGTPQFMSPEQACGLREQIDHRSDQFSLAAIAYVLLTGHEPFTGDNPIAVLYEVVHHDPPPPSQIIPALGSEIDAVVMRGLAKESADRFPNVLAFASALRAAVHGGAAAAFIDPISEPPPVRTPAPLLVPESLGALPSEPMAADDPADVRRAPVAAGRDTVRMIRRMRWRQSRTPRRFVLLTLVAVAVARLVHADDARADAGRVAPRGGTNADHGGARPSRRGDPSLKVQVMARIHNDTRIGDLRTRTIPAVPEHVTIGAARKVAELKRVAELFVERDGRLVGVLNERTLAATAEDVDVATVMASIDGSLHPAMPASRARELFMQSGASILPVAFGALLLGALSRVDVEQALAHRCAAPRPRRVRLRAAA